MSTWRLHRVARALQHGAVIAYPTDTIWGLGCAPLNHTAVSRIQRLKKRPSNKGLILLGSSPEQFSRFVDLSSIQTMLDKAHEKPDKPETWIVAAASHCPTWLTSSDHSLALRITDKPLVHALCSTLQCPLISTSANLSGQPSARNSLQVRRRFQAELDFIVDDPYQHSSLNANASASRIIDLRTGKILRP